MPACDLIVHADDFGLSERVNQGIVEAHRDGILTSTSLMAPGRAFEDAIALAQATPTLDIGVHLTLVEERPVTNPDAIPTLVAGDGRFHQNAATFLRHYINGSISLDDVRRELDAQIGAVLGQGMSVTHLDGHQHLHMVPRIRSLVGELARKYAIPSIRYPREAIRAYMLKDGGNLRRVAELAVLNSVCAIADASGARRPDHFVGFYFGGRLSKERLRILFDHLPDRGTCELMCHPGLADESSVYRHWGYCWEDERDALVDPDVKGLLATKGIRLISYSDLLQ